MVGAGMGSLMFITTLLGAAEPLGARLVKPVVGAFVALEMVGMVGMVGTVGMLEMVGWMLGTAAAGVTVKGTGCWGRTA